MKIITWDMEEGFFSFVSVVPWRVNDTRSEDIGIEEHSS